MRGGRDRDEFGQPLNDAEEEGVEEGHGFLRGMENGGWGMEDGG
jgi:hypothetical protein